MMTLARSPATMRGVLFHPKFGAGRADATFVTVVKKEVIWGAARIWNAGRRGVMKRTSLWDTNDKADMFVKTVKVNAFRALAVVIGQFDVSASRDL